MKYKIADLVVELEPNYKVLENRAKKYIYEGEEKSVFDISVTDELIQKELIASPKLTIETAEYMLAGSRFYKQLLDYQGCLLHASAVVVDGEAYLFSANCGTGKSTHTSLWLKYLADKKPYILNDDKPAIRIMEDGIYAYGTPFSGKHDISENKKVKLKAICFIEQSPTNSIERLEPKNAIRLFFEQTIMRLKEEPMIRLLEIVDIILKEIPIYKLRCNMSEEAVKLSYHTMKEDGTNED